MDPKKWRRSFVYCQEAYLGVYEYHDGNKEQEGEGESPTGERDLRRETVLLVAGCANTCAVYTMLDDRSLPDFLYKNGYNVWMADVRGHGEVSDAHNYIIDLNLTIQANYLYRAFRHLDQRNGTLVHMHT